MLHDFSYGSVKEYVPVRLHSGITRTANGVATAVRLMEYAMLRRIQYDRSCGSGIAGSEGYIYIYIYIYMKGNVRGGVNTGTKR